MAPGSQTPAAPPRTGPRLSTGGTALEHTVLRLCLGRQVPWASGPGQSDSGRYVNSARRTPSMLSSPPDPPPIRVDAPTDLGAGGADRLTDDGDRRPPGRREGATQERCLRSVKEILRCADIRLRIAGFTMHYPSDEKRFVSG